MGPMEEAAWMRSNGHSLLLFGLSLIVSGCSLLSTGEEFTKAVVENRDATSYLVAYEESGVPLGEDVILAWELPAGVRASSINRLGGGAGDLVLLTPECEVLDRVPVGDRRLELIIQGGEFASIQNLPRGDATERQLEEVETHCG